MSLDKAIEHGKEHRRQYRGSKAIDKTCRNHGDCPVCLGNRFYQSMKANERMTQDETEWMQSRDE